MGGYIIDNGQKLTLDQFLVYQEERIEAAEKRCKELQHDFDTAKADWLHAAGRCEELESALGKLLEEGERHFDGAPHVNCSWGPFLASIDEARTALKEGEG